MRPKTFSHVWSPGIPHERVRRRRIRAWPLVRVHLQETDGEDGVEIERIVDVPEPVGAGEPVG